MINIEKLAEMNHWWKIKSVKESFVLKEKRDLFYDIKKYMKLRQIIGIVGLRRVGKTTVMYQFIQDLIENNTQPENILYFSFDEYVEEIRDLINFYQEKILRKEIEKEKIYVFLDEIQKLDNWESKLKIIYDTYPNIKFFISGSASLNILLDAKESLAGRIFYFYLDLLSFEEFLKFKGKLTKIKENIELWKTELKLEINNYLLRPFPEIINLDDDIAKRYIKESVLEKTIFRDLSSLFEIKDIELIEKIIHIIASNPGIIINLDDLSKDLSRSRQVISNYLYYLECCFVIKSLKNFKGSLKASSRKLKKYYLSHPALSLTLELPDSGKIVENLVMFKLKTNYYWREKDKEIDFVLSKDKSILPVEVKSGDIKERDIKNMLIFLNRFKTKKGIIISNDKDEEKKINGNEIIFIPLWKWLLS